MAQTAFPQQAIVPTAKSDGQGSDAASKLTPMQQRFVVNVADHGLNVHEAAARAGFSGKHLDRLVRKLLDKPHVADALKAATGKRLLREAPRALHRMVDLSENARSQRVQFEATKDLLDRAGIGQTLGTASGSVRLTINLLTPQTDAVPSLQIEGSVVSDARDGEAPD